MKTVQILCKQYTYMQNTMYSKNELNDGYVSGKEWPLFAYADNRCIYDLASTMCSNTQMGSH